MNDRTRRKLTLAFTIYNQGRAEARRSGDPRKIVQWNQVLGRLVKDAYRPIPAYRHHKGEITR